jgi:hypothetical protein
MPTDSAATAPRRFLFLCASARRQGNSERLARRAAAALSAQVEQHWLALADHPLPPFEDLRHRSAAPWAPAVEGEARVPLDATLAATDLVLVAPLYWYSLPAAAKLYLDHWTAWLRAPGVDFKARMAGRTLWAVTVLSDTDPKSAAPLHDTLRLTADDLHLRWGGHLLGYGNRPGDIPHDRAALAAAGSFFRTSAAG